MSKALAHPSFGVVPEDKFREAERAPAMKSAQILRQFDPLFGIVKGDEKLKTFEVKVSRRVVTKQWARTEIRAKDQKQAEQLLDAMDWEQFDWADGFADHDDDYEIEEMEEVE